MLYCSSSLSSPLACSYSVLRWGLWLIYSSISWKGFSVLLSFLFCFTTSNNNIHYLFPEICDLSVNFWSEAQFSVLKAISGWSNIDWMTLNSLVLSTGITHHWWSSSTMQSTFVSTQLFNFLQPFHIASINHS